MPWGWTPRQEARAQSHAEPSSTKPWKEHEAKVLKRLLESEKGRFNAGGLPNNVARYVYLQEQARAGVRDEAEADLVAGFRAWLQGTHAENKRTDKYQNKPDGRPHRRKMDGTRYPDENTDWQSTPWGDAQLTHLPGVREWLREEAIATDKADLEMQLLADYGPHDLESAWRYYKHWVLKRPDSYPHAHADLHGPSWDTENWHGPGMASRSNRTGWVPRRSSHFDALPPPPPSKPPGDASEAPDFSSTYGGEMEEEGYGAATGAATRLSPEQFAEMQRLRAGPKTEFARIANEAAARARQERVRLDAEKHARRAESNEGFARIANSAAAQARKPRRSDRDPMPLSRFGEWDVAE